MTTGLRALAFLRDGWRILRSGLFMHSAYANRYLGTRRRLPFALIHFLLRGEARGFRANPFIDPAMTTADGRPVRLADYCRPEFGRTVAPSARFDPRWYAARHLPPGSRRHPFRHFWSQGFDQGLDPAPDFDLAFFKDFVAIYRPDKKEFLFERVADGRRHPRDEAELVARQAAFHAGVAMRVVRAAPTDRRRLVFVQAAHDYAHPYGTERDFDVLRNVYDGAAPVNPGDAEIVVAQNGSKVTAVRTLLAERPDLLLRYDHVLFLDDDVVLGGADIERLFAIVAARGLDLAQPALTADSYCAYAPLKRPLAGTGVRPISMVEIMMPVVSRRALETCGAAFSGSVSGWGVDGLLSKMVRERFGETVALLADVVAEHRRGVDTENGAFYRYLDGHGLEPAQEMALLVRRHGISPWNDAVRFT